MKGATIIASTMPPAKMLNPVGFLVEKKGIKPSQRWKKGLKLPWIQGTIATMPHTPYTTDGIAANRSMSGFMTALVVGWAYSER